jgi:hypothetical protein
MDRDMKVIGKWVILMVLEFSHFLIVQSIKGSGKEESIMEKDCIRHQVELSMMESGFQVDIME